MSRSKNFNKKGAELIAEDDARRAEFMKEKGYLVVDEFLEEHGKTIIERWEEDEDGFEVITDDRTNR